jgi:hypothetical protein
MSSPRAKPAKAKAKPAPKVKAKADGKSAAKMDAGSGNSAQAASLAAVIERALADGRNALTPEALQALTGAVCKAYAARIEAGEQLLPLSKRSSVSPTEVMVTASGLLRAANLAVFELGMWQSWTGR